MTVIYDYFPDIYSKFLITQLLLKILPKYRKNFLKIACFKSFLTVPRNFGIRTNFLETFESLFPQIIRKNFTPYFHRTVRPKICLKLLLKILNTYFLKLFLYAAPLQHHCVAAPPTPSSNQLR